MTTVQLPPGLSLVDEPLPAIQVDTPAARATVTLQGAHLTHWQPAGAHPVLFLSPDSQWREGAPIRGGIPVCFPWFGGGRTDLRPTAGHSPSPAALDPSHGWARLTDWNLTDAAVAKDGTARLVFELPGSAFTGSPEAGHFPDDALARFTMRIGAELHLEFEVHAGNTLVDVETALHTYFAVSDITAVRIRGLANTSYWDKLDKSVHHQMGDITFTGETDRVHDWDGPVHIVDTDRSIEITSTGANSVVVWNPWILKSRAMPDFGDEDYRHMVCVESGNVLQQAIVVPPGQSHLMSVTYRLR